MLKVGTKVLIKKEAEQFLTREGLLEWKHYNGDNRIPATVKGYHCGSYSLEMPAQYEFTSSGGDGINYLTTEDFDIVDIEPTFKKGDKVVIDPAGYYSLTIDAIDKWKKDHPMQELVATVEDTANNDKYLILKMPGCYGFATYVRGYWTEGYNTVLVQYLRPYVENKPFNVGDKVIITKGFDWAVDALFKTSYLGTVVVLHGTHASVAITDNAGNNYTFAIDYKAMRLAKPQETISNGTIAAWLEEIDEYKSRIQGIEKLLQSDFGRSLDNTSVKLMRKHVSVLTELMAVVKERIKFARP